MKDTISSLKEIAEDREISLSYNVQDNINDIVIGDSCLLQSILSQLISSGAIRVNKSCQVDVIVMLFIAPYRKANEKDRILRFIVRDNVKGISQDKLQEINAKFTDLHSIRDPEILDSSLGFANYIVNKLSGKLEIKSEAKWNLIITLPSKL
ncbi:ATP-binding protein [Orientia tsutsugamushi]|nr:ATP-binding protein [Orientia tsutsugamushi]